MSNLFGSKELPLPGALQVTAEESAAERAATAEQNRTVFQGMREQAAESRRIIEERRQREEVIRIEAGKAHREAEKRAAKAPPEPVIRCVVRKDNNYGGAKAGTIVEVTARELAQVSHCLQSLADAAREQEKAAQLASQAAAAARENAAEFERYHRLERERWAQLKATMKQLTGSDGDGK